MTDEEMIRQRHYARMTESPVPSLIMKLAAPTIISMLVSSIYNMADTYFVSRLGTSAAGAVGVVFSVMAIIQAVGFTIGMGGGVIMSRQLGAKENGKAACSASTAFFFALALGILLAFTGVLFNKPLMRLLGATGTILPYAQSYAAYIFLGAPFMCTSFVMNNLLRSEGKAAFAMVGITAGGVLNIVLDPLFIFTFDLGTAGAAIATSVSQAISFLILLAFFMRGKSNVRINIRRVSLKGKLYLDIVKMGLPSLSRQGLASLAAVALNVSAAVFGDAAVAAMSITSRITFFIFSALLGFGQGFQPVCSFNWGARRYGRVYEAVRFTAAVGTILMIIMPGICFIFSSFLLQCFISDDVQVIEMGSLALRAQCFALAFQGICVTTNMALQSTSHYGKATFLALCRQGIFFIPVVLILPRIIGLNGVLFAQSISDILTFFVSIFFFISFLKEVKAKASGTGKDNSIH